MSRPAHRYSVTEPARTPWEGFVFAYAAMVPIVAGGIGVWLMPGDWIALTLRLTLVWTGAIVTFLSGVRRGLSFRAPEGPTVGQIASFFWVFVLGALALAIEPAIDATILLLIAVASLAVLDTMAAAKEDAPPYFARLRPPQMAVAFLGLLAVLARQAL